ncbi:MAG: amino acid adenylation domain-containing protein [Pseudomonadota bacterium]
MTAANAHNIEDIYPLSPLQQGMLFHTLLDGDSGVYLMQDRYRIGGAIDGQAFLRAWQLVVQAHPALRTSFVWKTQKQPMQIVHQSVDVPVEQFDLRGHTAAEQEAFILDVLAQEQTRGFDLSKPPLIRFRLVRLADASYEFIRSFHHILMDAWCISLVTVECMNVYADLIAGRAPRLARPRRYRDYIDWLQKQDRGQAQRFWQREMAGIGAPTSLVVDQGARGDQYASAVKVEDLTVFLDQARSQELERFCQVHRITPNTLFQGVWALLLSRYSGNRDVLFGVTVAGRPADLAGVEHMIGLFINTLPLRVTVDEEQHVLAWLQGVQAHNLEIRQFEHTPLVDIQGWSDFPRGEALFDSILVYENAPVDDKLLRGDLAVRFDSMDHSVHTHYGLTAVVLPGERTGMRLSYDTRRFGADAVARMLGHMQALLLGMLAGADAPLAAIDMLPPAERHTLLHEWNASGHHFALDHTYAALFAQRAAAHPDRIAAVCGADTLTYAELDRRANRIAEALRAAGAGPDTLVALMAERGLALLTMMIGVFKAGAAYLPLDVLHPPARLADIVDLSRAPLLLASKASGRLLDQVLSGARHRPVALLTEAIWLHGAGDPLPAIGGPGDLAYVIFTSGSTGQPKGAMVEQRGMLNNIFGKVPTLGMDEHDRIAQTASPAFDISVWQFLAAPLVGGTVHILPDAIAHDPFLLLKEIDASALTLIEAVPTVIRGMLDVCPPDCTLASLRWVLPTGEALPPAVCRAWFERFPSIAFMNAYGPAECSDDVAFHAIATAPDDATLAMPIGRPTANNRLYIVDPALRPVPIGVPGEICVAGVGVGRGYLNDPERTAAAFVPHPFEPGARFYRTGDMGRYRADGVIEFLGRRDQQVKVRGYRIELGEIESRLALHPAVQEAALVTQEDARGETQLLAYWSRKDGHSADAQALREHLAQHLPHYMVPAVLVELDSLPLNPNGKVDRKALAARRTDLAQPRRRHVAPRTSTEQQVAAIWSAVLALPEPGIEDSFFSLGGHSLLATQVISRIRTGFKLELPLRAVFEFPTIAQLARAIDAALARQNSQPLLPAIVAQERPARLPLSFAQQRLWFLEQFNPGTSLFNIPFALELTGELDTGMLMRSFESLLARHEVLRTGFSHADGEPWQHIAPAAPFALALIDVPENELAARLEAYFGQPFELAQPPLLRAQLLRLDARRTVLAVVLHHLVSDAWSATLAMRELTSCYAAYRSGGEPALEQLPIQYADFALWQRAHLQGPELERQLAYWRRTLGPIGGRQPRYVLDLPHDHPRPAVQDYASGSLSLRLPPALSQRLHRYAGETRLSAFSLVFAAFAALLHRFSGETDILIGTPASNRQRAETESMLGILLNNLVIRSDFSDHPGFATLARRVGDALFEAQRHQDLPFEQLVDVLAVPRSVEHAPLFQVMVAQQLTMESRLSLPGLELRALDTTLSQSECELDLHVACPHDGPVDLELLYASALFEPATAQRLLSQLAALLEEVLEAPQLPLASGERQPRDRQVRAVALSAPSAPVTPVGETESAIAAIWSEVLRLPHERVGRHDNFFHLGGHSLLATVVLARMRQRFGSVPALRELFANPTIAQLAPLVGAAGAPAEAAIGVRARPATLPLSFAQQRLWFLSQLSPAAAYNISSAIELRGHFEPERMRQALALVAARHEILRGRIVEQGAGAVLLIDHDAAPPLPLELTTAASDQDWEQAMQAAAAREAQLPFDLARAPLLRARLLQRAGRDQVLLMLTVHHCVADDWSVQLLIDELAAAYHGRALAPLPIQYVDYSLWQRDSAQQQRHRVQLDYWRATLEDGAYVLDLPTDRPRGALPGEQADACHLRLPEQLASDVRAYASAHGASVFMLLLAALKVTLGRYAGQRDVRIGTPVANRGLLETQGLIGCFVNTLVIRSDIGQPFPALLDQVRQQVLAAQENQDVPFEQVVDALVEERNLAQTPLFQVLFVMQNARLDGANWPGLALREIGSASRLAKFDLNWEVHDDGQTLGVMLEYRSALFDGDTMERWLAQWQHVLRQAIAGAPVELLAPAERNRQLVQWNDTAKTYTGASTLTAALEAQLAASPDAPALLCDGATLSYARLHARANRLAHALRAEGVGRDSIVAVCMERSLDMVLALLAIVKAGAAYLPIDPALPPARIAFMLGDAQAPLVLTQPALLERLPHTLPARCLDAAWLDAHPESAPAAINHPADLAYVIYTSGSTGVPKGVLTEHAALMNRLHWMQDSFAIGAQDRVLQKTPYSFDVSVWEFFWPLICGATLVMARPGGHQDSGYLVELVRQAGVTTLHFVPSMLQAFVAEPGLAACATLRQVFCSGEALPQDLQQRFCAAHPAPLINLYGPTEAAIDVSVWRCDPASVLRTVPIGKPIANLQLYVLDEAMRLLPQGAVGELYIGGAGLARAYLNRLDLTAERFVAHPFQEGARLYRTGDRCRFLADGNIVYLGRFDHQVKLRGLRIELGEIETGLTALAGVEQAVAVVTGTQLIAYIVPASGQAPGAEQLAQALRAQLPSYMVPSAFVVLERLPLTSNGKIDRKALPAPDLAPEAVTETPHGDTEQALAQLWAEVLSVPLEQIGRHSNFFRLGGQSLLATVLLARMRQRFGSVPALRELFANPTIAQLAPLVGAAGAPAEAAIGVRARPATLPLSFAQQRLWFLSQLSPAAAYNISSAIELRGHFEPERMRQALALVAARHEILRGRIVEQGAGAVLLIDHDAAPPLPLELTTAASDQDWEQAMQAAAAREAQLPFDLARAPLLRARLLQRAGRDQVLLMLTVHHCVADDWSVQLLIDELAAAYHGRALAPLPIQYVDYSLWQRDSAQQQRHRVQLDYWRATLEDGAYVLDLPTDRPRGALPGEQADACHLRLPEQLASDVRAYASAHGASVFMLLLAALKVTLGRYAGQRDVRIGTPVANRGLLETQGLIGCFVNTLVIRSDIGQPFPALLDQVRQQVLAAQENQDVPFEQVVDALVEERNLAQTPLFQVLFVMQNARLDGANWPGLALREIGSASRLAKFDLNWEVHDDGQTLGVMLEYRSALFDGDTMERWLAQWQHVLRQAIAGAPVELLAPAERNRQLVQWNDTAKTYTGASTLTAALEAQLAASPDAPALLCDGATLSYARLHARANRLAHALRAEGVGRDSIVAVCMERSLDMVLALLAIVKAGAAYLPIDPALPPARIAFMLGDAQAPLVLTQPALLERLPHTLPARCLDAAWLDAHPESAPAAINHPADLAYVIYTSGSTGVPKGVLTEHAALMNRLHWMQDSFAIGAQDRVLQKTPYSFDVSVWEFFWPLICGATLVMARPGGHQDSGYLVELVRQAGVTTLHFVPSMLQAFVAEPGLAACATLRQVFCSGEALPQDLQQRFCAAHPAPLINLYGPTEAAIDVSVWRCDPASVLRTVPIGKPIANLQLYVLDEAMRLLPQGAVGELYIGGAGLARAYLNRLDLTAERFVAHPFQEGARLYRTGDRCRFLADGNIVYLGRFDHQVKLRGLRIELGEIETGLTALAGVEQAVAVVTGTQLIAYIVPASGQAPGAEQLAQALRAQLPSYMVPSAFVVLERLPLTSNGKIDRKALPAPTWTDQQAAYRPPASATERTLCALLENLLKLERVGLGDNFFSLGGDSIVGLQFIAQARADGIAITPRQLFQQRTVGELALVAGTATALDAEQGVLSGAVPLMPIQHWFFEQDLADPGHWNQSVLLRPHAPLTAEPIHAALTHLVEQHDALRLRFTREHGQWRQHYGEPREAYAFGERTVGAAQSIDQALADFSAGADLARGPLLRAALLHLPGGEQRLYLAAHHLVVDTVSWRILLEDFANAYGRAPVAPAKTSSVRQWAERVGQHAAPPAERAYWEAQPAASALPVARPDGANRVADQVALLDKLSAASTADLLHQTHQAYRTQVQDLLLAALAATLCEWSGAGGITLDMEGHGRQSRFADLDVSRTVGWFTTLYPVHLALPAGGAEAQLIQAVKEQMRAIPEHGFGYGALRYLAGADGALAGRPRSPVLFNYLGRIDGGDSGALLALANDATPPEQAGANQRTHELEFVAAIHHDVLQVEWRFSGQRLLRDQQQQLLSRYMERLRRLIDHCQHSSGAFTPSDFPMAKGMNQQTLNKLLSKLT